MHGRFTIALASCSLGLIAFPTDAWARDELPIPVLRLGFAPAVHLAPESEEQTTLGVDLTAGMQFPIGDDDFVVVPGVEAGYAFDRIGVHTFNVALGIGAGHPYAFISYHPRFLVGKAGDATAVGMRNGLAMHVLMDIASLEIAQQFMHYGDGYHHDLRFTFGVNPAAFIFALAMD